MPPINKITKDDVDRFKDTGNFNHYQHIAGRSAVYPGQGTTMGLIYCALKCNGEAGELAEHIGKAMRDDDLLTPGVSARDAIFYEFESLTPERKMAIVKEAGDVLWYLAAIARELNMTLEQIAITNLQKLADRTERGTLKGGGDER